MNKTRFIIAVTQRLSAAPESEAKVELIEELSENLYSRYQDMAAAGMPEEEAYEKALGELGDVDELLAYLNGLGPEGRVPPQDRETKEFVNGFLSELGSFVQTAVGQARDAMDDAAAIVQDAAHQVHIHMGGVSGPSDERNFQVDVDPDGSYTCSFGENMSWEDGCSSVGLRMVDVSLIDGDVTVRFDADPAAPVRLEGETEGLQVQHRGDVLHIRQGKTASSSFFFGRMLRSTDIELILPRRRWEELRLSTASGDVTIDACAECARLNVNTASGDVDIGPGLRADVLNVRTASGDVDISEAECGQAVFKSASGDISADGIRAGSAQAESMSGDVELTGGFRAVQCSSASGDVELCSDVLPEQLKASSTSGDCEVALPDGAGFKVQFRAMSGELHSDFPLTGPIGKHSGEAVYLDGGDRVFRVSSISGDVALRRQP